MFSSNGQYPALTVYNGQVTVVFSDSSGSNYNVLTVKSFNLTVWVTLISTTSWTIGQLIWRNNDCYREPMAFCILSSTAARMVRLCFSSVAVP